MTHPMPHAGHPVTGRVEVPGSKSETNRALVLAALGDGPSRLFGVLRSRDSDLMLAALAALGVAVEGLGGGDYVITPPAAFRPAPEGIDCGLAGTVMRFIPPLAALADGTTTFRGDPHASERPMAGLLDGLRQLGATVSGDRLPFDVTGPVRAGGVVEIDSSPSSQFVSGLLMVGARLTGGLRIRHVGAGLPSRPHIDMTTAMLRARGVEVDDDDPASWEVAEGPIAALDQRIEPDLTNAAVFLSAAAATGGAVTVPGWPAASLQPGALFLDVVGRMGARVETHADAVTVTGPVRLAAVDVDLHTASELTPVVASLAALAEGTSTIRGVSHIRGHETDRLKALTTEFARCGIDISETADGLVITGGGGHGVADFETYADHRMVHAAAILALRLDGLGVTDLECVGKTMPDFEQRWQGLVG